MFGIGLPEIVIILIALGVLFFGGKKISELARSVGRMGGEFKKGKQDIERELKDGEAEAMQEEEARQAAAPTAPTPPAQPGSDTGNNAGEANTAQINNDPNKTQ